MKARRYLAAILMVILFFSNTMSAFASTGITLPVAEVLQNENVVTVSDNDIEPGLTEESTEELSGEDDENDSISESEEEESGSSEVEESQENEDETFTSEDETEETTEEETASELETEEETEKEAEEESEEEGRHVRSIVE